MLDNDWKDFAAKLWMVGLLLPSAYSEILPIRWETSKNSAGFWSRISVHWSWMWNSRLDPHISPIFPVDTMWSCKEWRQRLMKRIPSLRSCGSEWRLVQFWLGFSKHIVCCRLGSSVFGTKSCSVGLVILALVAFHLVVLLMDTEICKPGSSNRCSSRGNVFDHQGGGRQGFHGERIVE